MCLFTGFPDDVEAGILIMCDYISLKVEIKSIARGERRRRLLMEVKSAALQSNHIDCRRLAKTRDLYFCFLFNEISGSSGFGEVP